MKSHNNWNINDATIATGGALSLLSDSMTVAGDFTTSGGLLGASCYNCDSSNDYYANTSSINFRSDSARDYTVEFWMKPDSVTNAETDRLVHSDQRFAIWKYEDDIVFAPNYDVSFTASAVLTAGKWTHVACTWDTSENALEIFIDGKEYVDRDNIRFQVPFKGMTLNLNDDSSDLYSSLMILLLDGYDISLKDYSIEDLGSIYNYDSSNIGYEKVEADKNYQFHKLDNEQVFDTSMTIWGFISGIPLPIIL